MINIKIPGPRNLKNMENFFIKRNLKSIVELAKEKTKPKQIDKMGDKTYLPTLKDLYRIYQFVLLNKRTTILEFGSGWSSLILSLALKELRDKFSKEVKLLLRRNNPFELFVLDNQKKYLNITRDRIKKFSKYHNIKNPIKVNYHFSDVEMTLFNNRICTEYKKLPLCNPDFIYLDGPNMFNVKKDINGISLRHKDMMPMVCDILKFEYFYTPGTIIVCDGRGSNAKFLRDNFTRNWEYYNDRKSDQQIFYLNDPVLGKFNDLQLKFYNK